jgi:hypothetical protein
LPVRTGGRSDEQITEFTLTEERKNSPCDPIVERRRIVKKL